MLLSEIGEHFLRKALLNRILNGGWTFDINDAAKTIAIATAAIQRQHGGLPKTDAATGNATPTAGTKADGETSAISAQAASTVCYYVLTMTNADTAAYKLYKGDDGVDAFPVADLVKAMDNDEIPIAVLKFTTGAGGTFTALTDNFSGGNVSAKSYAIVNGVIPVAKPSDLTYTTT